VSLSSIMSFNQKSTVIIAGLLVAVSSTLTGCFGSSDTAASTASSAMASTASVAASTASTASSAMASTASGVGNAALTKLVTEARGPLVAVNMAVKSGDAAGAKTKFAAFEKVWTIAAPQIKTMAGDKYTAIETGVNTIKSLVGGASLDKEKAGAAITGALKLMDGLGKK
jgi:hypothetical protein